MGDEENVNLLEQTVQFQNEKLKELEKETDQKFGKIEEKIERIEERQHRQENDITSVKSDVAFIKSSVQAFTDDWRKHKEQEENRKYDQHKQMRGLLGKFFVGIAVTVLGGALLVAFGLK